MSDSTVLNFSPGGFEDRIDNRDYQWSEVGGSISQPFNWQEGFDVEQELGFNLIVKDQGLSYSCGGQAWGYLAEVLEALNTGSYEPRSAKYMYAQTWAPGGGSRGRDNADIFVNQGVARESIMTSYENRRPPSETFMEKSGDIKDDARQDAKFSKASAYAQTGTDIESVATALQRNHGVILGVEGSNNGTWQSEFPEPPSFTEWRHWVYACAAKLINGKKHIRIINSWGTETGNEGRQWLSEDYFKSHIFSGWTHVFAPPIPVVFKHNFQINMNLGDTNTEVQALQTALKIDGEFPNTVPPSGFYGEITRKAVLDFQRKYNIATPQELNTLNGKICGPATRLKLNFLFNR